MIIALGGKMQSGKNTIASIIQCLTHSKDTGYTGSITEKDYQQYMNGNNYRQAKWQQRSFAGKLKEIASLILGIPVSEFEKQEVKDLILNEEWWYYQFIEAGGNSKKVISVPEWELLGEVQKQWWILQKPTVRWFLQHLGTDAIRDNLHPNAWVNALMSEYKYKGSKKVEEGSIITANIYTDYPCWIITDMRFPNEYEAVKSRGGITIRVNRKFWSEEHSEMEFPKAFLHPSETALDNHQFDYEILNDSSIENLIEQVRNILQELHIL